MADYTPVNADNAAITLTAGAIVTGGRCVKMSADDTVIHTVATTDRTIGVTAHDAPSGGRVTVYLLPGFLHELLLEPGAVTPAAGAGIVCSTTPGSVNTTTLTAIAANTAIGICVRSTVNSAGTKVRVLGL